MKTSPKASILTHVLVVILLLLSFKFSLADGSDEANIVFSENFDGSTLDTSKWIVQENTNLSGYPAWGGSIAVNDSCVWLSTNGSVFPWISTVNDPFPAWGDFAVTWKLTYTCIADWGDGLVISYGSHDDPMNPYKDRILTLWAGDQGETLGLIYIELFGQSVFSIPVPGFRPTSDAHLYRLEYKQGNYTVCVDGKAVASAKSEVRPNSIGIGHPPVSYLPNSPESTQRWAYWGWTSSKTDYVEVELLGEGGGESMTEISLSTNTESQEIGYRVDITGTLMCEGKPISDAQIFLSYAIPAIPNDWNTITVITTDSGGVYSASWLPTATGLFILKATYTGSIDYSEASTARNISVLQSAGKDFFFVESNSTLSSLAFNSTSKELSFSVSGLSGTSGYVKFMVPKELVPDISGLKVFLDDKQLVYTVTSENENWLLNFEYSHSSHIVIINMMQSSTTEVNSWITMIIVALALAAPLGFFLLLKRHRKQ